jgi:hypothetical protein
LASAVDVVVVPPPPTVVVVVVVVLVGGCSHTVMVTFCGGVTSDPAEGLCVWTVPGVPPLDEQSTWVNEGVSPGVAEIAELAAACVSPTTLGTVAEHGLTRPD